MVAQDVARAGSRVRVRDVCPLEPGQATGESEFELADELADPFAGRVSIDSPLGRALLGRRPGERVQYRAPGGVQVVVLVAVD